MRILVTGAAGFIGMHLCKALLERGHEVVGFDNLTDLTYEQSLKVARLEHLSLPFDNEAQSALEQGQPIKSADGKITFYKMDLRDDAAVRSLIVNGNFHIVVNLAALAGVRRSTEIPSEYLEVNLMGLYHVVDAIKEQNQKVAESGATASSTSAASSTSNSGVKTRLVFASSSSVYGDCERTPFRESDHNLQQVSVYAASKMMDETLCSTYARLFKVDSIGLRFFTVYGPYGRPDMAPFIFTKAFLEDKEITLFNEGKSLRDFTFVGDIVQGIIKVLEGPDQSSKAVPFDVFNIGNGHPIQLFDFVHTLEEITDKKARLKLAPMPKGDVQQTYADVSKLEQAYHFTPQISLKEGLTAFYQWYRDFYHLEA